MDKILKGILKYRHTFRHGMVEQFEQVKDNPAVSVHLATSSRVKWIKECICRRHLVKSEIS